MEHDTNRGDLSIIIRNILVTRSEFVALCVSLCFAISCLETILRIVCVGGRHGTATVVNQMLMRACLWANTSRRIAQTCAFTLKCSEPILIDICNVEHMREMPFLHFLQIDRRRPPPPHPPPQHSTLCRRKRPPIINTPAYHQRGHHKRNNIINAMASGLYGTAVLVERIIYTHIFARAQMLD